MRAGEDSTLERLLSAIRADLRKGNFARLETYCRELEAALAGLGALPLPVLLRIRQAAQGNAACLSAAMSGLRAARQRLDEIGAATRGATYDAQGRRHALARTERPLRIGSNAGEFPTVDQERLNPRRV